MVSLVTLYKRDVSPCRSLLGACLCLGVLYAPHPERVLKELRQGRRVTSLRTFPMHAGTFIR